MRIIAGEWRGRSIEAPAGAATRPTSDRAREALFSMLQSRMGSLESLRVADLFAGSGALGLEALSRGAGHCTFVENDRAALQTLERNVDKLGARNRADIRPGSAFAVGGGPFDVVMMDPPYLSGLGQKALTALIERNSLAPGAWVSLETAASETVTVEGLDIEAERRHGKAKLTLFTRKA